MTNPVGVDEARRIVREAEAAEDARMRAEIRSWPDDELYAAAEECDSEDGPEHCWRCAAYRLFNQRQSDRQSRAEGGLPGDLKRSYNGPAADLRPGDALKHLPFPGNDYRSIYVVVRQVEDRGAAALVTLQVTNSDQPPFQILYPRELTLSILTNRRR